VERKIQRVKSAAADDEDERKRLEVELGRRILSGLKAKREAVYRIAIKHPGERILVFSESIGSIEALKRYLAEKGVKAEAYHGGKPEHLRDAIFGDGDPASKSCWLAGP